MRAATALRRDLATRWRALGRRSCSGNHVIEIRQEGIHKGVLVDADARAPAMGADAHRRRRLHRRGHVQGSPADAVTVRVGGGRTSARFRLAGPDQVRAVLAEIAASRGAQRVSDNGTSRRRCASRWRPDCLKGAFGDIGGAVPSPQELVPDPVSTGPSSSTSAAS